MLKDVDVQGHNNILIRTSPTVDQRTYNAPTASQVAAIWIEGDASTGSSSVNIVVHGISGESHRVLHYYGCFDPLQYPILFPFGECGWHQGIGNQNESEPLIFTTSGSHCRRVRMSCSKEKKKV